MVKCIVNECQNCSNGEKTPLFPFPGENPKLLQVWLENMKAAKVTKVIESLSLDPKWTPSHLDDIVCRDHFEDDDFIDPGTKGHLKPGSYPTKFGEVKIKRVKKRSADSSGAVVDPISSLTPEVAGAAADSVAEDPLDSLDLNSFNAEDIEIDSTVASFFNEESEFVDPDNPLPKRMKMEIDHDDGADQIHTEVDLQPEFRTQQKKVGPGITEIPVGQREDHSYFASSTQDKASARRADEDEDDFWTQDTAKDVDQETLNKELHKQIKNVGIMNSKLRKELLDLTVERDVLQTYVEETSKSYAAIAGEVTKLEVDAMRPNKGTNRIFNADQKLALRKKNVKKVKNWSQDTLKKGYELMFVCEPGGYEYLLQKGYPYPPIKVLRKHALTFDFEGTILKKSVKPEGQNTSINSSQIIPPSNTSASQPTSAPQQSDQQQQSQTRESNFEESTSDFINVETKDLADLLY